MRPRGGRVVPVHALVATGVNADGHHEILGIQVATSEDGAGWLGFSRDLTARGPFGDDRRRLGVEDRVDLRPRLEDLGMDMDLVRDREPVLGLEERPVVRRQSHVLQLREEQPALPRTAAADQQTVAGPDVDVTKDVLAQAAVPCDAAADRDVAPQFLDVLGDWGLGQRWSWRLSWAKRKCGRRSMTSG